MAARQPVTLTCERCGQSLPEPKKPGEETYDNFIAEEKENEK